MPATACGHGKKKLGRHQEIQGVSNYYAARRKKNPELVCKAGKEQNGKPFRQREWVLDPAKKKNQEKTIKTYHAKSGCGGSHYKR